MKFFNQLFGLISRSQLTTLHPYLPGDVEGAVEVTSEEEVYNCLHHLEGRNPSAGIVIINNSSCNPQMVLMNHSRTVLCLEYESDGQLEAILPIRVNKSRGINRQVFYRRYIIFLPLPDDIFTLGNSSSGYDAVDEQELQSEASPVNNGESGKGEGQESIVLQTKNTKQQTDKDEEI